MIQKFTQVLTLATILLSFNVEATSIGGVINDYSKVTAIDVVANEVTVKDGSLFTVGDKALLIQMQGAVINETNSSAFGDSSGASSAGLYEFLTVCTVTGNDVVFEHTMQNSYDTAGSLQLVTVPVYSTAEVTSHVLADPWDGQKGGVIAFEVTGLLKLQSANIAASKKGFRGGTFANDAIYTCSWFSTVSNYFLNPSSEGKGGDKGEGIAVKNSSKDGGRGAQANGGGGGNDHNSGGGGGGNYSAGGQGGERNKRSTFYCGGTYPGVGGKAQTYNNTANRVYMGGGGGAGHGNNNNGRSGALGGGIVIIKAGSIDGKSRYINSFGENAVNASNDGGGGGGSGGAVLIETSTYISPLNVWVYGGNGSSTSNTGTSNCNGPGGGGAGGVLWLSTGSTPASITLSGAGGSPGTILSHGQPTNCSVGSTNNGTSGGAGGAIYGLSIPESSTAFGGCTALPVELVYFTGKQIDDQVAFEWKTATEISSDHFIVQRSADGKNYEDIIKVSAAGNSSSPIVYTAYDHNPIEGISYYRLKEVDIDGADTYSGFIMVEFIKNNKLINTFPVPVAANNSLSFDILMNRTEKVHVLVFNSIGAIVIDESFMLPRGQHIRSVSIPDVPTGVYIAKLQLGNRNIATRKLFIIR